MENAKDERQVKKMKNSEIRNLLIAGGEQEIRDWAKGQFAKNPEISWYGILAACLEDILGYLAQGQDRNHGRVKDAYREIENLLACPRRR